MGTMRLTHLLAFILTCLVSSFSQVDHQHLMPQTVVIDGRDHPDQIPDATAYRLFFVSVSIPQNATTSQKAHQAEQLSRLHMADGDRQVLLKTLADFQQKYADLINNYNSSVTIALARGIEPDSDGMLREREALVQATIDELKSSLTSNGLISFVSFIQSEKSHMKIARAALTQ